MVEPAASPADLLKQEAEQQAIVRATTRLVAGDSSFAVQDILDAAGLSTRAFYRHFASKEELLSAMYRSESQAQLGRLTEEVACAATPPHAAVAWIDYWVSLTYERSTARRIRLLTSPEVRAAAGFQHATAESRIASIALLSQTFTAGRHRGDFPLVDPLADACALQAAVVALLDTRLLGEPTPPRTGARERLLSITSRLAGCRLPAS